MPKDGKTYAASGGKTKEIPLFDEEDDSSDEVVAKEEKPAVAVPALDPALLGSLLKNADLMKSLASIKNP